MCAFDYMQLRVARILLESIAGRALHCNQLYFNLLVQHQLRVLLHEFDNLKFASILQVVETPSNMERSAAITTYISYIYTQFIYIPMHEDIIVFYDLMYCF